VALFYDLAQALGRTEMAVVSGFRSPVEQSQAIRPEWRAPIKSGRLLLLTICEHQRVPDCG